MLFLYMLELHFIKNQKIDVLFYVKLLVFFLSVLAYIVSIKRQMIVVSLYTWFASKY